jgi:hypothetical protein
MQQKLLDDELKYNLLTRTIIVIRFNEVKLIIIKLIYLIIDKKLNYTTTTTT